MEDHSLAQDCPKPLLHDFQKLQAWLEPLSDVARVECDGMTRLVSHLLSSNGIEHFVASGVLVDLQRIDDPAASCGPLCGVTHWWIELGSSYVVDFRARMWLGPDAQHGVFIPSARFEYRTERRGMLSPLPEPVLDLMAGVKVSEWPEFDAARKGQR
ncbi:hypothetical protein [Pseudomonas sp. EMN2]|uniref:hypothetical protein n=1 Tax=Pseudomonas sp. EMN2 TaxID=2615212 RepID=UPI00129B7BD2|nr:hypothetical protein [Pseudomonas sp. EMN2]